MPGDKVIQTQCPACGKRFKVDHGKIQDDPLATGAGNAVNGLMERYRSWVFSKGNPFYLRPVFVVVGLGILFFLGNHFYENIYRERQLHSAFAEAPTVAAANDYLADFSNSDRSEWMRHQRDSLRIEAAASTITSTCDLGACDCNTLRSIQTSGLDDNLRARYATLREDCAFRTAAEEPTMKNVDGFLAKYSNSMVYGDSIKAIKRKVLARMVSDYDASLPAGSTLSADQQFFRNALSYVATSGDNTIYVDYVQRKSLKDWTDYSQETLASVDQVMELSNTLQETYYPLPSSSPPESINRFFKDNTGELESFLIKSIRTKVDSLFGPGTLRVRRKADGTSPKGILMNVEYLVSTLEDDLGEMGSIPSLYVWTQTESRGYSREPDTDARVTFKGYMLATGIEWDLTMRYPGAPRAYVYQQSSRPQAEIRNVNTQTQAQLRMMATAFHNFSESFLAEFGVE